MHKTSHIIDQASTLRQMAHGAPQQSPSAPVFVWTVTSGKGGVGKSMFALNFSMSLAERGRTVLLVDADENLATLDVMLGVSPKFRIPDVLSGGVSLADAVTPSHPNVFLLAGSSGSANYPEITHQERNDFIRSIIADASGYSDIVFDTGAGIHDRVLAYAAAADEVIVVSHYEPVAVLDAYAAIKMIVAKNSDISLSVVMNKSTSPTESDEAAMKLQKAVKHFLSMTVQYLGVIPFDPAVGVSVVKQVPLLSMNHNSSAALCIRAITNALCTRPAPTYVHQEAVYA
jgi:flagellar biosynthesis protein FlhG